MAILRDSSGQFYDVPDDALAAMRVPAEQVKTKLGAAAGSLPERATGPDGED